MWGLQNRNVELFARWLLDTFILQHYLYSSPNFYQAIQKKESGLTRHVLFDHCYCCLGLQRHLTFNPSNDIYLSWDICVTADVLNHSCLWKVTAINHLKNELLYKLHIWNMTRLLSWCQQGISKSLYVKISI